MLLLPVAAVVVGAGGHVAPMAPERVPVIVELFTSEGCSSCPAADAALRELETTQPVPGVEIIALGQHVDYWNRLGWADAFSSAAITARQRTYAARFGTGAYTPQAVVNGRTEFVGSRRDQLQQALTTAAAAPRATVTLTATSGNQVRVNVSDVPAGTGEADVLLAITEANLETQVGRGENAGRRLRHASVVRDLRRLGPVGPDGHFSTEIPLTLPTTWQHANLRVVALVQARDSRWIVGAARGTLDAE